ncbi:MAG: DUF4190 domain-containing protein [Candidatus Omnitrophica bacterium]|nr:DUF4190 domain-containing protein [Candidatus Omnitrophota bacterium]
MIPEQTQKTSGLAIAGMICGIIALIPVIGLLTSLPAIVLGVAALIKISNNKTQYKGNGLAISGIIMGGSGILTVPILIMFAAVFGENFIAARINANDSLAVARLRTLSVSAQTYATANDGLYPISVQDLLQTDPPYIDTNYCEGEHNGFYFDCVFDIETYQITARPVVPGNTGSQVSRVDDTGEIFFNVPDSWTDQAEIMGEISFDTF